MTDRLFPIWRDPEIVKLSREGKLKMPEMIKIDKKSMKLLLETIGEKYKCMSCGVEITEDNFGIIDADVQVCNDILCQIEGVDKLEENSDARLCANCDCQLCIDDREKMSKDYLRRNKIELKTTDNPKGCGKMFYSKKWKNNIKCEGKYLCSGCDNQNYTNFIKEIRKIPINSREKQIIEMVIEKIKSSYKECTK